MKKYTLWEVRELAHLPRLGTRTDREQTIADKIDSISAILKE
ncbi:hypothetical protein CWATWH0003_B348 [Crocosphaera watsonii WH 0003]|uniref:Uncharacterized protein n=1 Tax=Crocosphaera watsonii WH 0003 TaxID=423471 RepID=G5JF11_CROWT|nr:hypothetical protein CWATWH0003_B348 [Crocosphaera watsonii WH 0003]